MNSNVSTSPESFNEDEYDVSLKSNDQESRKQMQESKASLLSSFHASFNASFNSIETNEDLAQYLDSVILSSQRNFRDSDDTLQQQRWDTDEEDDDLTFDLNQLLESLADSHTYHEESKCGTSCDGDDGLSFAQDSVRLMKERRMPRSDLLKKEQSSSSLSRRTRA